MPFDTFIDYLDVLFLKYVFTLFYPFSSYMVVHNFIISRDFFYIFEIHVLCWIYVLQISSSKCGLPFYFLLYHVPLLNRDIVTF